WDTIFVTEIKQCGKVLQGHQCWCVGKNNHCCCLFLHEVVEVSLCNLSHSVVLVCHDANVNYFYPYILVFGRHSHDIKCVLSRREAKVAMFYISDYIMKMDVKTYEVLSLLL
ncbi:hypothetical protein EDD22DRAFT_783968, partial [Suillus occidentalis]